MRVLIDLDPSILNVVQKIAYKEKRSRKQMLELLIEEAVKN